MELDVKAFATRRISSGGLKQFPTKRLPQTKKLRGSDSVVYTAICPLVYVVRVFGLAPYEFHNEILISSSVNSVYAYVCIAVYTYIIYSILARFTDIEMEKPLLGHTETAKAVTNYFTAIFDIVVTVLDSGKFVKIWNSMQDYDVIVNNLGYARNESKTWIMTWIILGTSIIIWLAVHKSGMYAFSEPFLQNIAYMLVYVATSVSIIKFSGLVLMVGQRFNHLNVMAKKSGPLASGWLLASPIVDSKDVEYLHNLLLLASESLNSLYSWSLLLWLFNLSMHIVSDFYFLIQRLIMADWSLTQWRILGCLSSWIASFLAQLVLLNIACHFASTEANSMGYIMISWKRWLNISNRNQSERSVESSLHFINRRLGFSAAGCFYVNLPLLRSIAALLTTYLVILLQFPE